MRLGVAVLVWWLGIGNGARLVVLMADGKAEWTDKEEPLVVPGKSYNASVLWHRPLRGVELEKERCKDPNCSLSSDVPSNNNVLRLAVEKEKEERTYKLCLEEEDGCWVWAGVGVVVRSPSSEQWIPGVGGLVGEILLILSCLFLSGLFSGLNLGLMSLDVEELMLVSKTSPQLKERDYAAAILPVRRRSNWLLCSILLGNCLVNCALTVLVDNVLATPLKDNPSAGLHVTLAVLIPTLGIVVFGEILPQSLCHKLGLVIGAKTIYFTWVVMVVTGPLSYPLSLLLDAILGPESPRAWYRHKLIALLKRQSDPDSERAIAVRALQLRDSRVKSINYTLSHNIYCLNSQRPLNIPLLQEIKSQGFSRIPIHNPPTIDNVFSILHARDLLFLSEPCQGGTVAALASTFPRPVHFLLLSMPLKPLLREFTASGIHMAILIHFHVQQRRHIVKGLITMDDLMEHLMQKKIADECDSDTGRVRQRLVSGKGCADSAAAAEEKLLGQAVDSTEVLEEVSLYLGSKEAFGTLGNAVLRRLVANCLRSLSLVERKCLLRAGRPSRLALLLWEGTGQLEDAKGKALGPTKGRVFFGLDTLGRLGPLTLQRPTAAYVPSASLILVPGPSPYTVLQLRFTDYLAALRAANAEAAALSGPSLRPDQAPTTIRIPVPPRTLANIPLPASPQCTSSVAQKSTQSSSTNSV